MNPKAVARSLLASFLCIAGALSAAAQAAQESKPMEPTTAPKEVTTASGLRYTDLKAGSGAEAKTGNVVEVHYTGWLENGTKFDSSHDRNQPFRFKLGAGQVIRGWDEGVAGMKIGGKRKLVIPAELGYGRTGAGGVIPPGATLVFEVELLGVS
jgi:FKBP-type peptidyl-prolyl cis-trans isomerase